jgi:methyl-accepting chemotaxis protein
LETPSFKEQFLGNLADIAVVMGLALAILGIGMTIIIRRVLIHRLENLIHIAKEIATGRSDSGKRLPEEPADELGQLSHWINQFSDNLGVVLRNLSQMSQNLAQGTKGIYSNLTHVSDQSDAGAQDADLVDQKTSNVSDSVTSLSQEVLLLSESVSTIAAASEELTASLQQVTQICENELQISDQASAKAREVENLVDHLDEQFQQVSKILEVIDSIAANTNLLALNATIEAARAGEAGKGFAVVASEVKDLARKTAQATGSIGSEMESMRVAVTQTVSSIKQISEVNKSLQVFSNQVLQAVREQSATVNGMSQSLSKTETVARGIAHGAEVASTELRGAQHGIHGIRGRSVETASSIATIKRSLSEMQQLAEQLEKVGMSS